MGIVINEFILVIDLKNNTVDYAIARQHLLDAGNGISTGTAVPPELFAAGQAVAAANAAYGAAMDAARQAIWDSIDAFNEASEALEDFEDQVELQIAQMICGLFARDQPEPVVIAELPSDFHSQRP